MGACQSMRLFEHFLMEMKSRQVLYHFTTIPNLEMILEDEIIKRGHQDSVSLTRNFNLIGFGNSRITLNQDKLKSRYKIIPYHYGFHPNTSTEVDNTNDNISGDKIRDRYGKEREERIDKDITYLSKYIVQVDILNHSPYAKNKFKTIKETYESKLNVPFNLVDKWEPVKL